MWSIDSFLWLFVLRQLEPLLKVLLLDTYLRKNGPLYIEVSQS